MSDRLRFTDPRNCFGIIIHIRMGIRDEMRRTNFEESFTSSLGIEESKFDSDIVDHTSR